MISLAQVQWQAGDFRARFDGTVPEGALLGILGPSGGGKSTLLSLIAGFAAPVAGRIRIGGQDVTDLPPHERPVSLIFQEHNLFAHLTAFENAALGLSPGLQISAGQKAQAESALARVGLAGKGAQRPAELSGGERQRVALARALLRDKPVLLLDEPFSGLGPRLRRDMLALLRQIQAERGLTLLLVSHEPEDIRLAASHGCFVADGRMGPVAPVAEFFRQPGLADYL